ncbi:MAG TPA: hypothetical protein VML19_07915 [Verrucomicrobiae bacterium]|nr:hypothetical protein [Verrucomicrobiae bacterium]
MVILERLLKWAKEGSANPVRAATVSAQSGFDADCRRKKVVFAAHCMLNQNARDAGSAEFAAMMKPLLEALVTQDIGIIQLPCPELMVLGLGRGRDSCPTQTIRERLESAESQVGLESLVDQVVYQIQEYRKHGFQIIGILGKNGSPACGVGPALAISGAEGVFIRLLRQRIHAAGLDICIEGIDDDDQRQSIEWISKQIDRVR